MRSRDGNLNFSLAVCSVIFFSFTSLYADEYLISYRYVVKDATLFSEEMAISKTMRKCIGKEKEAIYLDTYGLTTLKAVLSENSENFIEYIHKLGLHIDHREVTINAQNHSTTILTLKTTCFKVDFNDNFAKIAPLK